MADTGAPIQDFIVLAGMASPGLAVVRGAGSPRSWDVQKGYGLTGATVVFTGEGLAKFDVDIFCWEPEHFAAWKVFAKATLAAPAPVRNPASLSIQHPALNDEPLSITQVEVEDVTQWEQDPDGGGLWVRTIKFLQYRKPRPVLVKPFEGPPGSPVVVQAPVDPQLILIGNLLGEVERLAQ